MKTAADFHQEQRDNLSIFEAGSGHRSVVHVKCQRDFCVFCEGGLFSCRICGSFEGATTTHCPGYHMTQFTSEQVYAGRIDYREGRWVRAASEHTPAHWHRTGDMNCIVCEKPYSRHSMPYPKDCPTLKRLCDGSLVKL